MNKETTEIIEAVKGMTPEQLQAYNAEAMKRNRQTDRKAVLDLENVAYNLGQSVNRLDCFADYFDEIETTIESYNKQPTTETAAFLGAEVMHYWGRWKTLIFDAKEGVTAQIKVLEGGE